MEFMHVVAKRHSIRDFTSEQIREEDLDKIILVGNAAPIGKANYELLHMTIVQNGEVLKNISVATANLFRMAQVRFMVRRH